VTRRPLITVYTRAGCHLCQEAERVVAGIARGRAEVRLVDIDADPAITERYTVRVPVVAVDGRELCEYEVDEQELAAAVAKATA
jgi:glutaredoxin